MFKNATIVTLFGLSSQIAGFLRMAIIAYYFGLSAQIDAYYLALTIPSVIALIFSNWLQLSFVGRYTSLITENREELAASFRTCLLGTVVSLATLLCLSGTVFPSLLFDLLLPHLDAETTGAFQKLILMLVPIVAADFMGQALNAHGRFGRAAFAPLANATVAVAVLWFWQDLGLTRFSSSPLTPLIGSLLAGSLVQLLIVIGPYLGLGKLTLRFTSELRQEMMTIVRLTAFILPAIALSGAMFSILLFSVAQLAESTGQVAAMTFANRLNSALSQLMVMGFSTVLLPQFASLAVRGEQAVTFHLLRRLARGSVVVGFLLCVLAYLLAEPVINLLLVRGAFEPHHAEDIRDIFLILCLSIPALALGTFVARYYSALRRVDLLLWSGIVGFVSVVAVAAIGISAQSILIIAAAPLVAYSMTLVFWLRQLSTDFNISTIMRDMAQAGIRTLAISLVLVIADTWLVTSLDMTDDQLMTLVRCGVSGLTLGILVIMTGTLKWLLDPYRPAADR